MASPSRGIVTPEAVVLDFEMAGVASRGLGRLLDAAIQVALLFAVAMLATLLPGLVGTMVAVIGVASVIIGFPIACEVLTRGRSPGKAAMGLRVVTAEGAPGAARHAFIRSTVGIIDFLVPLPGGLIAITSALLTSRGQRLGDLVAGTIVIRERSAAPRATAVWFSPPHGLEGYAHNLDVTAVTDAQFGVIRAFLLRVHELSPEARGALALRLAQPVARAMHHTAPAGVTPELFLVCVASAYQRRHQPAPSMVSPATYPPPPPSPSSGPPSAPVLVDVDSPSGRPNLVPPT